MALAYYQRHRQASVPSLSRGTQAIVTQLVLLALLGSVPVIDAGCFFPDGNQANGYFACTSETQDSACCGTGYACVGHASGFFVCEATSAVTKNLTTTSIMRGASTDKSWKSANCPSVCLLLEQCPDTDDMLYCQTNTTDSPAEICAKGTKIVDLGGEYLVQVSTA